MAAVVKAADTSAVAAVGSTAGGGKGNVIFGPYHINHLQMDVSAHICPKIFIRELQFVFPAEDLTDVVCIPTMQCARTDLVNIGDDIEAEKDRLLERFMATARVLCQEFIAAGYWSDYIDPCSGLPMLNQTCNKVFSEVDGAQQLLGYSVMNAGCCKVLLHPQWGSGVYPASLFTKAPSVVVAEKLTMLQNGAFDKRIEEELANLIVAVQTPNPCSS